MAHPEFTGPPVSEAQLGVVNVSKISTPQWVEPYRVIVGEPTTGFFFDFVLHPPITLGVNHG